MPFDFVLPDLGEGTTEGEIRKWSVKEGDAVEEHQTVLEIETDKAVVEVPSPKKGRVLKINKEEGEIVKVGEVLMRIAEEGEMAEEKPQAEERPKSVSVVGVLPEEEETRATPAVRALAKELGIKLEAIQGSGPGGSITKEDVTKASQKETKAADQYGPFDRVPLRGVRRSIAKNLILSQKTTAFVTGMDEADITDLWNLREREKKALLAKGTHLTFLPFFMKAAYHALADYPMLNASVDEEREEIIVKKYYNIAVAVDTPDGLMVPVIKEAVRKTIHELAIEIQELSEKARDRKIKLEEMRGSTFTITNYGHFGGIFATPIINYPDVAILGTGKISEKPWVKDGQIVIRKILPLSLTFDHRVTDGVYAAQFLSKVIDYLEDPARLFIESA
ncbi:MAG TPA: 2-oxo acid dehydrogenase subunit E2 [Nitrospiraceae bacterium]|jgi:pyruvate dehydrogenase E2 component (dihydrolipoamide acetyltransferase)|nr:2-oxo acid dehydrogenase subunit E2 [Nitrospiraceae bacterium]